SSRRRHTRFSRDWSSDVCSSDLAFYLFFVSRTGDARVVAVVARHVVIADWIFTATTIVFQPLSGFYLAHRMGIHWTTPWVYWSKIGRASCMERETVREVAVDRKE